MRSMRSSLLALTALAVAGCGALIDRSDFKPLTPADVAKIEAKPEAAATPEDQKAADQKSAPSPTTDKPAETTADAAAAPATEKPAEPQKSDGSIFARLFGADESKDKVTEAAPAAAAPAAEPAVPADAQAAATPDKATTESAQVEAEADLENIPADEISEADMAGEEEADPSKIAVPTDDGRSHDFVNVYTSKPDRPTDLFENLPGVAWQGNLVITSLGPGGDPRGLFGGESQPYARYIPGMPSGTVQAMNGLLLAHSAINVSCVKPDLLGMVRDAERHFSHRVVITSGYRSPSHNRQVHGALHSQHLFCNAVDLYMPGVARDDLARYFYSHPSRGGIGLYCHTKSIHVDTGRRREWRWACKARK